MSVASNWTYHCKQYDFFYSLIQNHINTSIGYMYTYIHTYICVYIYARARTHKHTSLLNSRQETLLSLIYIYEHTIDMIDAQ